MNSIIIFGAGNYGKMALDYYGEENVLCFLDNSKNKIGTELRGKKIISFDEFYKKYRMYKIVIASNYYVQMAKQLDEHGITGYEYYMPYFERTMNKISEEISDYNTNGIALYGIDGNIDLFTNYIKSRNIDCPIYLVDRDSSNNINHYISDYKVCRLDEVLDKINCIIISNAKYAITIETRLENHVTGDIKIINPFRQKKYYETMDIVFNPYEGQQEKQTEEEWNQSCNNQYIIEAIDGYFEEVYKKVPLFRFIEIETINRCNGTCNFCPVNKKVDPRKETYMDRGLFDKIIEQLEYLKYNGELSLFSNNEPLMDERIIELSSYAREKLPKARIHMFTNGTLFTMDKFIRLIPYLDELIIDNYMQELKLIKPCREINEYIEQHPELREKVTIVLRKPNEILTSRGGDAPNRKDLKSYPDAKCALPFQQMIVRPDGKVSLCCNDPLGRNTLGDLTKESILDVWYGQRYQQVRKALSEGRKNWLHCKYCDTFYLY